VKTLDTGGKAEIDDLVAEMQHIENLSNTEAVDDILDRLTDGKREIEQLCVVKDQKAERRMRLF
jgi:archaellum component FlaD/FlaE